MFRLLLPVIGIAALTLSGCGEPQDSGEAAPPAEYEQPTENAPAN